MYYSSSILFDKAVDDSLSLVEEGKDWKVMQSTGLKDKNGKLIYEGDIVEYIQIEQKEHYETVFKNGCFGIINIVAGSTFLTLEEFILEMKNDLEIIGNKFEHPHLLPTPPTNKP